MKALAGLIKSVVKIILIIIIALLLVNACSGVAERESGAEDAIATSHKIEDTFASSSVYVNNFQTQENRLPTQVEFDQWADTQERRGVYNANSVKILTRDYPQEIVDEIGYPPEGEYLLALWRGYKYEYYAPWNNATSVTFDSKIYFLTDYWWTDVLLFLVLAIFLFFLTRKL